MAKKPIEIGRTGQTVRSNVKRLRSAQGLTLREMATRLAVAERPLSINSINEIESGARRVDVDDLMALAIALQVNPNSLLLPPTSDPTHLVALTGAPNETAHAVWGWANGESPLPSRPPTIPDSAPEENRDTYALAYFKNNTNPANQNWTGQPNIVVVPQDIEE
jgi:transcriptional regulator with XRE-family HTH domain